MYLKTFHLVLYRSQENRTWSQENNIWSTNQSTLAIISYFHQISLNITCPFIWRESFKDKNLICNWLWAKQCIYKAILKLWASNMCTTDIKSNVKTDFYYVIIKILLSLNTDHASDVYWKWSCSSHFIFQF